MPRKRLGQNFLVDKESLRMMVSHASLNNKDTVLEIGAGVGFLTEILAEKAESVIAVEVDPRLTKILRERLKKYANVTLIEGDILKLKIQEFKKVVSTPPYSISSPLLFWLLEKKFELAVLTFQEEFAKRLVAIPGTANYGRLTVSLYYTAEVEILDPIQKTQFWPPPDVNSRIVRLKPKPPPFKVDDEAFFHEVVKVIFMQKNKKIRNAIIPILSRIKNSKREILRLADTLPFHNRRPRELTPEEIALLANETAKMFRRHFYN